MALNKEKLVLKYPTIQYTLVNNVMLLKLQLTTMRLVIKKDL